MCVLGGERKSEKMRVGVFVRVGREDTERARENADKRKERVTKMHKHIQNCGKLCKLVTLLQNKKM